MSAAVGLNNLHTLTALTGRDAGANRTVIIQGFEARRRTVVVAAIGALPALLVTVVLWGVIGSYAALALPAVEALTFWLLEVRSRTGLQRRTYEALLDRKRSDAGQFTLCGLVIDPDLHELGTVMASTVPVQRSTSSPAPAVTPPLAAPALVTTAPVPDRDDDMFDTNDMFGDQR